MGTGNKTLYAGFSFCVKCQISVMKDIILINLLLNETFGVGFAQVLFHVATATDAISVKDVKGNACTL